MSIVLPTQLAIVIDAVNDFNTEDYIYEVEKLLDEQVYATKSFNDKYVFLFVSTEYSAKLLRSKYRTINIDGEKLKIKPVEYSRIQLLNVPAHISDELIKRMLGELDVELLSEIKSAEDGSFDRIVYVHPGDDDLIPAFLKISECINFKVGVIKRKVCSICYDKEHVALDCPDAFDEIIAGSSKDKRAHNTKRTHRNMSRKPTDYNIRLAPIKSIIDRSDTYPLSFEAFVSFLNETYGQPRKALCIARKYTNNIASVIQMMKHLSAHSIADRSTSAQLNRLCKALKEQICDESFKPENNRKRKSSTDEPGRLFKQILADLSGMAHNTVPSPSKQK